MPRRSEKMTSAEIAAIADASKAYKLALFRLGLAAAAIIGKRAEDGTRYKDVLLREAVLDYPVANFAAAILEKVDEESIQKYTIKELKDMLKEDVEPKERPLYETIKFPDKDARDNFNRAVQKFSEEEGVSAEYAKSFFVNSRVAEYLAEVNEEMEIGNGA